MTRRCCIDGCSNSEHNISTTSGSRISFHLFPKDEESKLNWKHYIRVCNNQEVTGKNSIVCSDHFHPSDVIKQHSKSILKSTAIPKIFPNSSPCHASSLLNEDATALADRHSHGTIELPVFVSVDESSMETDQFEDEIPSMNQMKVEQSNDNVEITAPATIFVNEKIYKPNETSAYLIKEKLFESASTNHTIITRTSTSDGTNIPFSINTFSNETTQISSELIIKDEIGEDSSPPPSDSSGECEIVEPPNPTGNTTVTISNLSMCPSLNPPMHPSLYASTNPNSNVVKGVPLSEYEMPPRKNAVRYPGDIDEFGDITPEDARKNLTLCKTKIKAQAKEIYKLKQKVKRQKTQIETMKNLLNKFKTNYGLPARVIRSIDEIVVLDDQ